MIVYAVVPDAEEKFDTLNQSLKSCTPGRNQVECLIGISCPADLATPADRKIMMSTFGPSIGELHKDTNAKDWKFKPTTPVKPATMNIIQIANEFFAHIGKQGVVYANDAAPEKTDYYCYVWDDDQYVRLCYHEVVLESTSGLVVNLPIRGFTARVCLVIRYWADNDGDII